MDNTFCILFHMFSYHILTSISESYTKLQTNQVNIQKYFIQNTLIYSDFLEISPESVCFSCGGNRSPSVV